MAKKHMNSRLILFILREMKNQNYDNITFTKMAKTKKINNNKVWWVYGVTGIPIPCCWNIYFGNWFGIIYSEHIYSFWVRHVTPTYISLKKCTCNRSQKTSTRISCQHYCNSLKLKTSITNSRMDKGIFLQ